MRKSNSPSGYRQQRGAALVIGLMLLAVLTLLAVSGMNSASLEFVMAGNEQYRSNAFQAAEAGIAQSMVTGTFNPDAVAPFVVPPGANGADAWSAQIFTQLGGFAGQVWGFDSNSVLGIHYEIQSTGTSVRNARAINTQGILQYVPAGSAQRPDPNLGNTGYN